MPSFASRGRLTAIAAAMVLVALAPGLHAQSSDPAELYKEALTREAPLRKELQEQSSLQGAAPLLRRIRVLVGAYEDLARLFPESGYSDNALWQGGALAADVYWRFGEAFDRAMSLRLLNALATRFPASSLLREASGHVTRLQAGTPPPAATAGTAPAPRTAAPPPAPASAAVPVATVPQATAPAAPATVTMKEIRREVLPNVLRLMIELDREVPFHEERLDNPPRVFVDLQNTRAADALKDASISFPDDLVKQVRVGRQIDLRTRVVFDLNASARYSVYTLYNPFRVVIDFERRPAIAAAPPPAPPAAVDAALAAARAPAVPRANTGGGFSLSRQLGLGVARIAIDPGHGGHDPGAKANGLTESNLVLDVALRLEKLLQAQKDVEVVLTRRTNAYVSLEERTAIANRSGADLFLSIHANASGAVAARGVETYFLSFAENKEAEAIAARENAGSPRSMRELPDIVEAIALNNKIDESRDFAAILQSTLYDRLRRVNRSLKNLGVKQAPFMVLIGATMPSVLAEISFMSNRQEAALLKTEKYRQQIAEALLAGVMAYQESLKKVPAVAAR